MAVYSSDSTGLASPVRMVIQSGADGYPTDGWGVAVANNGELYVQNFLGESVTRVFAPGANGVTIPQSEFRSYSRDSPAVAVGPDGSTYVARLQAQLVDIFPPGASGQTMPQELSVDGLPTSLTVDAAGELVVAVESPLGQNALEVFAPGATGAATPLRRIAGPSTGLGGAYFAGGEQLSVTFSALTGRLYAAVTGAPADPANGFPGLPTHISVFPGDANGDVAPLRTISGPATGLDGTTLTGIADNPASGNIWVMAQSAGVGGQPSTVLDFDRYADANATPVRSFTDATTEFNDVRGIAFGTS